MVKSKMKQLWVLYGKIKNQAAVSVNGKIKNEAAVSVVW